MDVDQSTSDSDPGLAIDYSCGREFNKESGPRYNWKGEKMTIDTERTSQSNAGCHNELQQQTHQQNTPVPSCIPNSNPSTSSAYIPDLIHMNPGAISSTINLENHPNEKSTNDCSSSECDLDYDEDDYDFDSAESPSPIDISSPSWKLEELDDSGKIKIFREHVQIQQPQKNEPHRNMDHKPLERGHKVDKQYKNYQANNPNIPFTTTTTTTTTTTAAASSTTQQQQQQQHLIDLSESGNYKYQSVASTPIKTVDSKLSTGGIPFPAQNPMSTLHRPWNNPENPNHHRFTNSPVPACQYAKPGALPSFLSLHTGPIYKPLAQFCNPYYGQNLGQMLSSNDINTSSMGEKSTSQSNPSNLFIHQDNQQTRGNLPLPSTATTQRPFKLPPPALSRPLPPATPHHSYPNNGSTNFWKSPQYLTVPPPVQYTYMNPNYEQSFVALQHILRQAELDTDDKGQSSRSQATQGHNSGAEIFMLNCENCLAVCNSYAELITHKKMCIRRT